MSVTVIKGRSGSGKSRYLTAHIRALIADPFAKVIVIVPGSLSFETEKKIGGASFTIGRQNYHFSLKPIGKNCSFQQLSCCSPR